MPRILPNPPEPERQPRAERFTGDEYVASISRVMSGKRPRSYTGDMYRFGATVHKWLTEDDKARAAFIKWFESL